jgi:hypothetical protein
MSEVKTTKVSSHTKLLLIDGLIGFIVALGLLLEARNLAVNYPVVWSVSSMSYWYWVAHYAGISVMAFSFLLVIAYITVIFFSDNG